MPMHDLCRAQAMPKIFIWGVFGGTSQVASGAGFSKQSLRKDIRVPGG